VLVDRHHADRPHGQKPPAHQLARIHVPLLDRLTSYPATVLSLAGVATALSVWVLPSIGFDYNVLNLQATGTESVIWERRVLANTGRSGRSALATASTLDELRQKQQAIEALPSVSEVDSVLRMIPDDQQEKIAIVKSFEPLVAPVRIGRSSRVDLDRLGEALAKIKRRFDMIATEAGDKMPADLAALREKPATTLRKLASADRETAEPSLNYLQSQLYRDFVSKFYSLQHNLKPKAVSIKDIPEDLSRKFVGQSGRFLMQIHPKVDIWEREGARQF